MKVITREVKKIENLIGSIGENIIGILEIENTDSPEMIEHVKEIIESRIGKKKNEELKIGDVVTLKSEALKEQIVLNQNYMTVSDLRDELDGQYAECIYFDDLSELQTVSVKVKTLVKVIKKEEE